MLCLPVQHPKPWLLVYEVQSAATRKFVDDSNDVSRTVSLWHPTVSAARHSALACRARHPADPLTDTLPARSRRSPPAGLAVNVSAAWLLATSLPSRAHNLMLRLLRCRIDHV